MIAFRTIFHILTRKLFKSLWLVENTLNLYEIELRKNYTRRQNEHPNPFCKYGAFGFSQSDEDGLTLEIIKRLGLNAGHFYEFGVGNGTENNTLILLANGWKGAWFGGEKILLKSGSTKNLHFQKCWITKENIVALAHSTGFTADVISLDLDGNDYHLVAELLKNQIKPKLFIVEYNAKFLPAIDFIMPYDKAHIWAYDDYYGASLKSFNSLFAQHGYRLICCNAATGANAFFVAEEYAGLFPEVPQELSKLYVDPFYFLRTVKNHATSLQTLTRFLNNP